MEYEFHSACYHTDMEVVAGLTTSIGHMIKEVREGGVCVVTRGVVQGCVVRGVVYMCGLHTVLPGGVACMLKVWFACRPTC